MKMITDIHKVACKHSIYFYLQLYMQHQYKPYDLLKFTELSLLLLICYTCMEILLMFIVYATHDVIFSPAAIVGIFIIL